MRAVGFELLCFQLEAANLMPTDSRSCTYIVVLTVKGERAQLICFYRAAVKVNRIPRSVILNKVVPYLLDVVDHCVKVWKVKKLFRLK